MTRFLLVTAGVLLFSVNAWASATLEQVRSAGVLTCGLNSEETDFSKFEAHGDLPALGRDVCRAIAAAVLGDAGKVKITEFPDDPASLAAVASGKVAVLVGATPDPVYEAAFGVSFGPPVFFDGLGFLAHRTNGPKSLHDLGGRQVCFITETKSEQDLTDRLAMRHIDFIPFPFEETGEMEAALVTGHCGAIAAPVSELTRMRTGFHGRVSEYEILPEMITVEPYAPVFRSDDPGWGHIVTWIVRALVLAEEAGVTQSNAATQRASGREEVRYLLGGTPGIGKALGLDDAWVLRAVLATGNQGEMFERDLGAGSPLRLRRGLNALWTQGGMMQSPPVR